MTFFGNTGYIGLPTFRYRMLTTMVSLAGKFYLLDCGKIG